MGSVRHSVSLSIHLLDIKGHSHSMSAIRGEGSQFQGGKPILGFSDGREGGLGTV